MQKLMIVEDDPAIRDELYCCWKMKGTRFFLSQILAMFTEQAAKESPDLILLDIGLPGQDGFSLCAALRKAVLSSIIFVTSRDTGADEVRTLSLGGDDYITKPYSVPVLLARIKAVLRRSSGVSELADVVEAAGLRLNLTKGTLMSGKRWWI